MRDVGAGADRDADIGLRQRRRVVDAVADHRDDRARGLEPRDLGGLVGGQDLGQHPIGSMPTCARDRVARSRRLIAGEHPDLDARPLERGDRVRRMPA